MWGGVNHDPGSLEHRVRAPGSKSEMGLGVQSNGSGSGMAWEIAQLWTYRMS